MRFRVSHVTRYDYAAPVRLGEHRLMLRPRDSHEIRLLDATLTLAPPARLRWVYDVFGNSVAYALFEGETDHLEIESMLEIQHYGLNRPAYPLEKRARTLPLDYSDDERADLGRLLDRQFPDDQDVAAWAAATVAETPNADTLEVLSAMMGRIKRDLHYQPREAEGVQTPDETLRAQSGSCRDFALLMMESCRSLGLAARFASGYLYDPALDPSRFTPVAPGATHAWLQVFLPGSGWVSFDPTNGHLEGKSLIPIAIARTPAQTSPISGTFIGPRATSSTMTVRVEVASVGES